MSNFRNTKLVVLDDDPTGIQTVHGCLLLTEWGDKLVREALMDEQDFFYILTNTRAMTPQEAETVIRSAMETVVRVNEEFGYRLIFVSRSDSCLRGHFPLEPEVMSSVLQEHGISVWHPIPFAPALIEAGRVTINNAHYMKDGDTLTPLSETEFAHDNVFGYTTSVLPEYIHEKGANPADYEIVNASDYSDLYAYVDKLRKDIASFNGAVVIRSSSSLPKALSGIEDKPLLDRSILKRGGVGCFIVGSHVKKTTQQLNNLLNADGIEGLEVSVRELLDNGEQLLRKVLDNIAEIAADGKTPVVYTSREEVRLDDADARQLLGQRVSDFLVSIAANLPFTPSYLIGKGGITSHDILTKGLGVHSARVLGQIITSVPCVMTPEFPYIIFPGNVGDEHSLSDVYKKLA